MATIHLNAQDFKDKIFNYETEQDWNFKGDKAAIIDFMPTGAAPANPLLRYLKNYLNNTKMIL